MTLEAGEKLPISLRLRPLSETAGTLQLGPGAPPSWKLREAKGEYWLDMVLDSAATDNVTVPIQVSLPGGRSRTIKIQVSTTVPSESVVATPRDLDFGELTLDVAKHSMKRLGIRKVVGTFQIKSVSSTVPFLKLEQSTIINGSNYLIRITIDPAKPLKAGTYNGVISVETDDGHKIDVPVKLKLT